MKLMFFSDIQGINYNLNSIKKIIDNNSFDKIIVLGDLYYSGPNYEEDYQIESKKVKDFLTEYKDNLIVLKGNCDSDVDVKASDFPICNNLVLINVDGLDIYCTHGNEYSMSKNKKINKGILVYGHEHIPYIKKIDDMIYICVGSISLPRDNNKPTYMIYENKNFSIYDIDNNLIDSIDVN